MNAQPFVLDFEGSAVLLRLFLGFGVMATLRFGIIPWAGLTLVLCVWLDAVTGWIARRAGPKSESTSAIENYADMLCFVMAPMEFASALIAHASVLFLLPVFLIAAVYRLARFQVEGLVGKSYREMPVTYNGYWFPLTGLVVHFAPIAGDIIMTVMLLLTSILMISRHLLIPEF